MASQPPHSETTSGSDPNARTGAPDYTPEEGFPGRLFTRLLVPYSLLIVAGFALAGWFLLRTSISSLDESMSRRLVGHARMVADTIKPSYLKYIRPGDEGSGMYGLLLNRLNRFRDSARLEDIFIIDPEGRVLLDADEELPIGTEYLFLKLDAVELSQVWQGQPTASVLYEDEAGRLYKSGYAPVFDEQGEVFAAVGVEAGADFLGAVSRLRRDAMWALLVVMGLTVVVSIGVSRSIVGPIQRLVSAIGQVQRKDSYPTVEVTTRDEVGYLTHAFNNMTRRLAEKDAELTRLYELEHERAERIQGLSVQVLEGIGSGVVAVDLSARVLLCNQSAADIVPIQGYPFPETGIPPAARDVLDGDNPVLRCLMESLNENKEFLREDVRWQRPDGEEQVLGISAFPLSDREGTPFGAITIFSDLTDVARLEDRIQIQARLAALGELSAGIAHEIRNPLGAIRGFVELLGRKVEDPKGRAIVDSILKEVADLNLIVSDFLTFSREPNLVPEEIDPGELAREALAISLPGDAASPVHVEVEVDDGLPPICVDPAWVKKALVNVIQNGATAMGDKGGTLRVTARAENGGVAFRVTDSGPGIPEEIRDRIFNPFFTTRADGTGLGLPIANKVVEGHGGHIHLETSGSTGTRFSLWFPYGEPAPAGRDNIILNPKKDTTKAEHP